MSKAHKFYDKENRGFELYLNLNKESLMMAISTEENTVIPDQDEVEFLEFDEQDIDDIIIALTDLKNDLSRYKKEGA